MKKSKPIGPGRPAEPVSEAARSVFLKLVKFGDSDRRAAGVVSVDRLKFVRLRETDEKFRAQYDAAAAMRGQTLAQVIRKTMVEQIQRGNWSFVRLALHNYFQINLMDPDVRVKRIEMEDKHGLAQAVEEAAKGLLRDQTDPADKTPDELKAEVERLREELDRLRQEGKKP